jgi:hypothetical protein
MLLKRRTLRKFNQLLFLHFWGANPFLGGRTMEMLSIGQVAPRAGVGVETVRFYEW